MTWRYWMSAVALLVALAACGGGEGTIAEPLACGDGTVVCGSSCVDPSSDPRHCGGCGTACDPGEICVTGSCAVACPDGQAACDGTCADLAADERNCGACGTACSPGETCVEGSCSTLCPEGQEVCDGACVNTARSGLHCGGCGVACGAGQACVEGTCSSACPPGQENCDGTCVSVESSGQHCGACGNVCEAGEVCLLGYCARSCPAGQAICDGGCFDVRSATENCGACGNTCGAGEVCSDGVCSNSCGGGLTECDGRCIDTTTSRTHCGGCGVACNGDEVCIEGACSLHCALGSIDCDGTCVDTDTHTSHCGGCNVACGPGEMCDDGSCVPACSAFANAICAGVCTNTDVDRMNCGGCGIVCEDGFVCDEGTCTAFCGQDKADCGGDCTSTDSDPDHCGSCGTVCTPAANGVAVCAAGGCENLCTAGFGDCNYDLSATGTDGCETALATDVNHCGACGNACPGLNNATTACVDSTCGLGTCVQGYGDCDGQPANGCEVDLAGNDQHCGACGNACAAGYGCEAGQCVQLPPGGSCDHPIVAGPGSHTITWHDRGHPQWITSIPSCGSSSPTGGDLVIEYQAVGTGTATVRVAKPTSQRWHMVVSDLACGTVVEYACMSDFSPAQLAVSFPIVAGQTYSIYLVDSMSGAAPLDNPLQFSIEEIDCTTHVPAIAEMHPAIGGVQYVLDAPIVLSFATPVSATGNFTLTDGSGNQVTIPASDPSIRYLNGGRTIVLIPGQPLTAGQTYTVSWTGMHSDVCPNVALAPPSWTFSTPPAAASCTPGTTPGMLDGTVTRMPTSIMGTLTEHYLAADDDPNGWVYLGGTTELFRIHKVTGFAQSVHGPAEIGSSQLGYDMAIDGTGIFTLESSTSGTTGHVWRISSDKGASWNVQDVALFPQAPNDDLRGLTVRGDRAHVITEEFTDGTEIWSVDVSGALPSQARLEINFGSGVLEYCEGLDADASYYYTTCRSKQATSVYYQVRIHRTTGAWAILDKGFDGNINSMAMNAVDTNGDGNADFLYFASDEAAGYAICNPTGNAVGSANLYDFDTGTGNYGQAWDPALGVLWAWDDGTFDLIRVD